jgi:tRNA(Ile2)-agmatinylcytidine synthase
MYVAFDDTDSTSWMCTTFLATEVVRSLSHLDLIGWPRLVRLNPGVPWKTRGNGALCLRFGKGRGTRRLVGRIGKEPIYAFKSLASEPDPEEVLATAGEELKRWSMIKEGASPGLVVSRSPPRPRSYWEAVRGIVPRSDVGEELRRIGARTVEMEGGRGVIGAAAAMAWRPSDRTFEVLAYRKRDRWGTPREVSTDDVRSMDQCFPSTFNNYDKTLEKVAIAPHSPCPILLGIRGEDPDELVEALASIGSEEKDRWLLFITNQGTDDHIIRRWKELLPNRSYSLLATVASLPQAIEGGHVIFQVEAQGRRKLDCAAYEPSRSFRDVVKKLRPGDEVRLLGELRDRPRTLNLEKLQLISMAEVKVKRSNPRCHHCDKSMQSMGRAGGYRCKSCGRKAPASAAEIVSEARDIAPGWYEPPVCSRRHLSKPLKRQRANRYTF